MEYIQHMHITYMLW